MRIPSEEKHLQDEVSVEKKGESVEYLSPEQIQREIE